MGSGGAPLAKTTEPSNRNGLRGRHVDVEFACDRAFERSRPDPLTGSLDAARDMDDDDGDQACRMIRTSKLNALPRVHTWPINVVVYHDPQGNLVSR